MNDDDRLLELGRFFDGELPEPARSILACGLATDAEAVRHLDSLHCLRRLANYHDPAAGVTALAPRRRSASAWKRAAVAAAVLALVGWPKAPGLRPVPEAPTTARVEAPQTAGANEPAATSSEVAWHRWANASSRRPEPAARALWHSELASSSRRGRRPRLEVLALELANSDAEGASRLQRDAVARRGGPWGRPRPDRADPRPRGPSPLGPDTE